MKKLNVSIPAKDPISDKDLKDKEGNVQSIRNIIVAALDFYNAQVEKKAMGPKENGERWELMKKVKKSDEVDLSADDIIKIRKCLQDRWSPGIAGYIIDLMEQPDAPVEQPQQQ